MKKIVIFSLLLFVAFSTKLFSQECGLTSGDLPISTYTITDDYNYAWSSCLYDSYQIGGTQTITKICVSINNSRGGASTLDGQKIWMRMTSTSSYSSCSYPGTSGFTKVYDGSITYPSSGFINISLDVNFNYNDDTKYLEVLWENTNPNYDYVQDWAFDRLNESSDYVGKWGSSQASYTSAKSNCSRVKYTTAIGFNKTNFVNCSVLPIELADFSVKQINKDIELSWTTTSEINNSFFTIETSCDGKTFKPISKINGAGNSNSVKKYYYIDKKTDYGIIYYRLKQTDLDGKYTYSKIISVLKKQISDNNIFIVYNSINNNLKLTGNNLVQIKISDITGKIMYNSYINSESKYINTLNFPKGIYFAIIYTNNNVITKKFIIP